MSVDYDLYKMYKVREMTKTALLRREMTDLTTYTASEARNKFADIFNEAHYGAPVVINKHGKKVAVVSMALLERLAQLEAIIDSEHATAALNEFNAKGGKTMKDIEKELGLD